MNKSKIENLKGQIFTLSEQLDKMETRLDSVLSVNDALKKIIIKQDLDAVKAKE